MTSAAYDLRAQFRNLGNILDLLLLVGGDIVGVALAQFTGGHLWYLPPPVVFSFGWVAYSFSSVVAVLGDRHLLPRSEIPCIVVHGRTGHARDNRSWVLGRMLRDFENGYWMPEAVQTKMRALLNGEKLKTSKRGLCITVFEAARDQQASHFKYSLWTYFGHIVAVVQLTVSAIPWIIWRGSNYIIFVITLSGTALAFATGSLPQWRKERFACRHNSNESFILTRGNGAQHAIVVIGKGRALNFDDLASSGEGSQADIFTSLCICSFTCLWVALLITVDGIKDNTWFLVAIGGIGSLYTSIAAATPRKPENFGIPLTFTKRCFVSDKVMIALMETEMYQAGLGRSMLQTFFPAGNMSVAEQEFWNKAKEFETCSMPQSTSSKVDARAAAGVAELNSRIKNCQQLS